MVIPDGDPGKVLVAEEKIEVGAVRRVTLPVVVEGVDFSVWLGDAAYGSAVPIFAVFVLVQIVSEMDDIVN